ncbi:DUF6185 family protein [Nonomuraea rubra]|uniref:DUF6185 family protein n=1 Tax=Nonomuraea rubra TaxID=46180 RepID=UPI0031ED3249
MARPSGDGPGGGHVRGVGLSERLVPAGEEHLVFPDEMPLLPWSAPLAIGASLILVLLLLIAVLNGLRLAWRPCADAALPAWAWWAATSGAALTVSYVCYASARDRSWAAWLDYDTASIAGVAWDQLWLPYSVVWLVSGSGLLWLWPLALVLAYLREQAAVRAAIGLPLWHSPGAGPPTVTGPSGRRRLMVVWVFAAGAMSFSEYYGGLYLPVKFVATAVTLWLILRVSRSRVVALHRLDDGRPLLATLEPGVFEQVRERALTFLETRRTGRMSDSGAAERPEKLKEEFEKLEQWPPGQEGKLPTGISPLHLALLAGPEPPGRGGPAGLAWRTGSITLALGVIPMLYLLWWDVQAEGGPLSLTRDAGMWYSANVIQEVVFWFLPGYLLGLLWRELPGRTGAIRSLSLSGAYAAGVVAYWVPAEIMDLADVTGMSLRALLLFVVLTTAGLVTDMRTLRTVIQPWNRLGRFLLEVYRLESIPSQATFILAQIAAVLAIIQFVRGQGGEPQYPSIDPFQVPRPPG